jgi:PGF-pre-PGF domain-containing protein
MTFAINEPATDTHNTAIISVSIIPSVTLGPTSIIVADAGAIERSQFAGRQVADVVSIEPIAVNPASISKGIIVFVVPGRWLSEHGANPGDVVFMKMADERWVEIPTVFNHQDGDLYYYTATTPQFSYFVITTRLAVTDAGTKPTTVPALPETIQILSPEQASGAAPTVSPATPATASPTIIRTTLTPAAAMTPTGTAGLPAYAVIAGVAAVLAGGFFIRRWWHRRQNPGLFR